MPIPDRPDYTNSDLELKDGFGGTKQDYTTEEKTSGYQLGKPLGLIPKSVNYNYILNYVNKWLKYEAQSNEYLFPNLNISADSGSENGIVLNSQYGYVYTPYEYTNIGAAKITRTFIDKDISYETGFYNNRKDLSITEFKGSHDIQNATTSDNMLTFSIKADNISEDTLSLLEDGMIQVSDSGFKKSFVRDYTDDWVYLNLTVNMGGQRFSFEKCLVHYLTHTTYNGVTNVYFTLRAYESDYIEEVYNQRVEYTTIPKTPIDELSSLNIDPANFYEFPVSSGEYPLIDKIAEAKFKNVRADIEWINIEFGQEVLNESQTFTNTPGGTFTLVHIPLDNRDYEGSFIVSSLPDGGGTIYEKDVDYSIDFYTGVVTNLDAGISQGQTVYVYYILGNIFKAVNESQTFTSEFSGNFTLSHFPLSNISEITGELQTFTNTPNGTFTLSHIPFNDGEIIVSSSSGGGTVYTEDVDYSIDFYTGVVTNLDAGISQGQTVYVDYTYKAGLSGNISISSLPSGGGTVYVEGVDYYVNYYTKEVTNLNAGITIGQTVYCNYVYRGDTYNATDESQTFTNTPSGTLNLKYIPYDDGSINVSSLPSGGGTTYVKDVDYSVNYTTGVVTNLDAGISQGQTVYIDYTYKAGTYNFTIQDQIDAGIVSRGHRPIYILAYGNPLHTVYNDDGVTSIQNQTERDAFLEFCKAIVERYKGTNAIFEIWNEPSSFYFWSPQKYSNELYYELAKQTYTTLKALHPNVEFWAPALDTLIEEETRQWMVEMVDRGILDYCDALSVHTYQYDLPELTFPYITDLYNYIYSQFPQHKNKKIVSSEDGLFYRWGPYDDPEDGPGQDTQVAYLIRRFVVNAYSKVDITNIYELADSDEIIEGADYYGLLDSATTSMTNTGQPVTEHLSFGAIKEFHTELEGMWLEQRLDSEDTGDALALFTDGTSYKICYWAGGSIDPRELHLTPTKTVLIDWIPKYTNITLQELIDYFNYI